MHPAYLAYREQRFFASLNGLRFLCIAAVMWHHSPASVDLRGWLTLLDRGFVGVDFFFILSGYLITTLLLREEARDGRFSVRGFYWRRLLRIVPVYFLVVTAVAGYYIFVQGRTEFVPLVPYYYLFLSNMLSQDIPLLSVTWSLAVEEQYYILWPALLLVLPFGGRARGAALIILICICALSDQGALSGLGLMPIETEHAIWLLPSTGYQAILLGSLLAVLLHTPTGFALFHRMLGQRWAAAVSFLILLILLQTLPGILLGWPNLVLHMAMTVCLASLVVREDHVLHNAMTWRPIVRIGEISYGLYLYHLIGLHVGVTAANSLATSISGQIWLGTVLFVPISIIVAEISFRTYERFFLRFR